MKLNARQLEAFRAVMQSQSITGAAELLNVSQPAVSQAMKALEISCGFTLFERKRGRILPTPEALALMVEIERLFVGINKIARVAEAIRDRNWGRLTIAAFPAMASRFLPKVVAEFCGSRPNVQVTVESRRSRSLIDWVAGSNVDVGIGLLPSDQIGVVNERLHDLPGVCALPVGHPLAGADVVHAADLERQPFISLGRDDRSRFGVDKVFDDLGVVRRIQIETEQSEAACAFVAHGAGVAVVDPFSAYEFDDREIVVKPFRPVVDFKLWALFPAGRTRQGLVEDFMAYFQASIDGFQREGVMPRKML